MKILYKKDTKGKTRYLRISTKGADLIQESGVVDSDKPVTHSKACTSKNKGKSNETTPEEQAKLEMASKIAEKLDEGYFETLEKAKTEEVILPMLAKSYADEKSKIDWATAYVQPKFDGMRCLAFIEVDKVRLMSRQGKETENIQYHVYDTVSKDSYEKRRVEIGEILDELDDNIVEVHTAKCMSEKRLCEEHAENLAKG